MTTVQDQARDTSSSREFYEYYARQSESPLALDRSRRIYEVVVAILGQDALAGPLNVLDVGSNAGTQSMVWAEHGHHVFGIDINAPLVELAKERAGARGIPVHFQVGTAEALPFADASMDVCLAPELLEHVPDWERCIREFDRVLRPGGVLFLTTTNRLCPKQSEYELPLYSWYPARLKRHYERLAVTTRPELVNHATYPAVHWFSYFQLRRHLNGLGFSCRDRFDAMILDGAGFPKRVVVRSIRAFPPLRWLAHTLTPYTYVVASKHS
jgi:ubiquinone/menaquinone biosynthesis C-methylase UbiE